MLALRALFFAAVQRLHSRLVAAVTLQPIIQQLAMPPSRPSLPARRSPPTKRFARPSAPTSGTAEKKQIAQALQAEGTSVSYKLARDITRALATTTLRSDLTAQVKVTLDCALVKAGVAP
jgi:hypothetical protein